MDTFWGVRIQPGQDYTLRNSTCGGELRRLRITRATLEDNKEEVGGEWKKEEEESSRRIRSLVSCRVGSLKEPILICALTKHEGCSSSINLDLEFEEEDAVFSVTGGPPTLGVHLAGFFYPKTITTPSNADDSHKHVTSDIVFLPNDHVLNNQIQVVEEEEELLLVDSDDTAPSLNRNSLVQREEDSDNQEHKASHHVIIDSSRNEAVAKSGINILNDDKNEREFMDLLSSPSKLMVKRESPDGATEFDQHDVVGVQIEKPSSTDDQVRDTVVAPLVYEVCCHKMEQEKRITDEEMEDINAEEIVMKQGTTATVDDGHQRTSNKISMPASTNILVLPGTSEHETSKENFIPCQNEAVDESDIKIMKDDRILRMQLVDIASTLKQIQSVESSVASTERVIELDATVQTEKVIGNQVQEDTAVVASLVYPVGDSKQQEKKKKKRENITTISEVESHKNATSNDGHHRRSTEKLQEVGYNVKHEKNKKKKQKRVEDKLEEMNEDKQAEQNVEQVTVSVDAGHDSPPRRGIYDVTERLDSTYTKKSRKKMSKKSKAKKIVENFEDSDHARESKNTGVAVIESKSEVKTKASKRKSGEPTDTGVVIEIQSERKKKPKKRKSSNTGEQKATAMIKAEFVEKDDGSGR